MVQGWVMPQTCSGGFACNYLALAVLQPALGVLLAVDGLVCFVGLRKAFVVGALLNTAVAGLALAGWGSSLNIAGLTVGVLALIAIILNLIAVRSRDAVSEQGNPMNLPVFG